jgi:hypothetical protein
MSSGADRITFGSNAFDLNINQGVLQIESESLLELAYDEIEIGNNGTLVLSGDVVFSGYEIHNNGGKIRHNGGTLTFQKNGDMRLQTRNGDRFPSVTVDLGDGDRLDCTNDDVVVQGDLTILDGEIYKADVSVEGNVSFHDDAEHHWEMDLRISGSNHTTLDPGSNMASRDCDLEIDKDDPTATVTLLNPWHIDHSRPDLSLTSGILVTSDENFMWVGNGSDIDGGGPNSYVDGPFRVQGRRGNFTFPVGNNGFYAPVTLSQFDNNSDHFTVKYVKDDPHNHGFNRDARDSSISGVSTSEHWVIDRTGGNSDVYVTLHFDTTRTEAQASMLDYRILRFDGTKWRDHGNSNPQGDLRAGSIRTASKVTDFSPFGWSGEGGSVLSNAHRQFDLVLNEEVVELDFTTTINESDIAVHFERSQDGNQFEVLKKVNSSPSLFEQSFEFEDHHPWMGESYYRVRLLQSGQAVWTSSLKVIQLAERELDMPDLDFIIYPNPNKGMFTISSSSRYPTDHVIVYDMSGRQFNVGIERRDRLTVIDMRHLNTGNYYVKIISGGESMVYPIQLQ